MALQLQNYNLYNGLVSDQAYIRVDTVSGNKDNIVADIKVYVSQQASEENIPFIDQKFIDFTPNVTEDSLNYHRQAYEYMKTLPEYAEAADC